MVRVKQRLGKYRIDRRLADGGFAVVFQAYDTIAGVRVALKVPHPGLITRDGLDSFRKEVRLASRLDHPNVLPVKDAGFIEGTFIIAYPLGEETLRERLRRRVSVKTIVDFADQMLAAVAYAHRQRVMHCDIKPENFIVFPGNRLRLTDFGISKVARRTLAASGSGTVGYLAPEQALGKPSFRSDVFSLGLVLYRMFSGQLPEWPFHWPPPGIERLRKHLHPDLIDFLRRSLEVNHRKRFADALRMHAAFKRLRGRALRSSLAQRRRQRRRGEPTATNWRTVRHREFLKRHSKNLATRGRCQHCQGPVAETMQVCPWCGRKRKIEPGPSRFPARCPRCKRGVKSDWRYCPWCWGPAINPESEPRYPDVRYTARCSNPACGGKLMPLMRYCPWCHRKVRKAWLVPGSQARCTRCKWGVLPEYWDYCPWCGRSIRRR